MICGIEGFKLKRSLSRSRHHEGCRRIGAAMGQYEKKDQGLVYIQDDGEITATLPDTEERLELSHKGDPGYQKIFYLLVIAGLGYLALVFTML